MLFVPRMCLDLGNSIQNLCKSIEYILMYDRQTTKIINMILSFIASYSWAFSYFLLFLWVGILYKHFSTQSWQSWQNKFLLEFWCFFFFFYFSGFFFFLATLFCSSYPETMLFCLWEFVHRGEKFWYHWSNFGSASPLQITCMEYLFCSSCCGRAVARTGGYKAEAFGSRTPNNFCAWVCFVQWGTKHWQHLPPEQL